MGGLLKKLGFGSKAPEQGSPVSPRSPGSPGLEPEQPSPQPPPHPELEAAIASGDETAWQIYADWLIEQGLSWGEVMTAALQGKSNTQRQESLERTLLGTEPKKVGWRRGVMDELKYIPGGENEPPMHVVLERVLTHPAGRFVRELTLGIPPDLNLHWHLEDLARTIAKTGPHQSLRKLDLSVTSPAMDQISWRRVGDISCIWKALPNLEELLLQGSRGSDEGLASRLEPIDAPKLKRFVFISGGLDESVPRQLAAASLPSLEHLELWLGVEDYGCSVTPSTLAGILAAERMPKLSSLAIKNSEWEDELIEAVAKSKLLPRLRELDFSMGVMGGATRAALLRHVDGFKHLARLDLSDNYFTREDQSALKAVLPMVVFGEQKPFAGEDDRYVSVSE